MTNQIKLTPRLLAVADMVPQGAILCDVGTDHAHLPAYLLQQGRIDSAIASDIRKGPLERAADTRAKCGLEEHIQLRLAPGLEGVAPHEVNAVTICGMGGEMMTGILAAAPWTKTDTTIILQPQNSHDVLRLWLAENGYRILREHIVQEEHRWYPVMTVVGGEMALPMNAAEALAGQPRLWDRQPLREAFLGWVLSKLEKQRSGLSHSTKESDRQKIDELNDTMETLTSWRAQLAKGEWPE